MKFLTLIALLSFVALTMSLSLVVTHPPNQNHPNMTEYLTYNAEVTNLTCSVRNSQQRSYSKLDKVDDAQAITPERKATLVADLKKQVNGPFFAIQPIRTLKRLHKANFLLSREYFTYNAEGYIKKI
jgi:hypothetical protein